MIAFTASDICVTEHALNFLLHMTRRLILMICMQFCQLSTSAKRTVYG